MPIATRGTVKALDVSDLEALGPSMILSNAYHLSQRPGLEVIEAMGGVHSFMGWHGPILADSGGFQVFSLGARKFGPHGEGADGESPTYHVTYNEDGAIFRDELSGVTRIFSPEEVLRIQRILRVDVAMILDVCIPYPATRQQAEYGTELTRLWAERAREEYRNHPLPGQKMFAIVQGSVYEDLRKKSARDLVALDFGGYAVGGISVGESFKEKQKAWEWSLPYLPVDKPRYLMGMGMPEEIVAAVRAGVDMFDCVLPTRNARHGDLFIRTSSEWDWNHSFYKVLHITNEQYKVDQQPPDPYCTCLTCTRYSRSFVRHLFSVHDPLALRLASIHNLAFYLDMMRAMREAILSGRF